MSAATPGDGVTAPDKYPYGEGFQSKIVALVLRDQGFLTRHFDVFRAEWFEKEHLATLAFIVLAYFKQYGQIPTYEAMAASVLEYARTYGGERAEQLRSSLSDWLSFCYQADLRDAAFVSDKMLRFGQRQALKRAVGKTIDLLKQDADTAEVRGIFEEALQVGAIRSPTISFYDKALDLTEHLKTSPLYSSKYKVSTGFPGLDAKSYGGYGAGELVVIAGPPGRGKSTVIANLARAAGYHFAASALNKKVISISLELKGDDLLLMFGALLSGVTKDDIVFGRQVEHYQRVMRQQLDYLGDRFRFAYFSPGSVGVEDIRWYLSNLVNFEGIEPGALFLDYADKLKGGEDDRYRGMGVIYDSLIAIGDKFGIPVVTGSQINREWSQEEVIDMRGIAESWLKAANCDWMLTLCQSQAEYDAGVMRIFIPKLRRGKGQGQIVCRHSGDLAYVREMTIEELRLYEQHKPSSVTPSPKNRSER